MSDDEEYYTAARDEQGNIRLNGGRGLLVANPDHTYADVLEWLNRAALKDPKSDWTKQYDAAATLLEDEMMLWLLTGDASEMAKMLPTQRAFVRGFVAGHRRFITEEE